MKKTYTICVPRQDTNLDSETPDFMRVTRVATMNLQLFYNF